MIHKTGGGYKVFSKKGKALSKHSMTKQEAMMQLWAVEQSKIKAGKETKAGRTEAMKQGAKA